MEELHSQTYSLHTCNFIYRVGVLFLGGTTFYKPTVYILVTIYRVGALFMEELHSQTYSLHTSNYIYIGLEHYFWKELHSQTGSLHTCNYIYRVGALFLGGTTFTNLQFTY